MAVWLLKRGLGISVSNGQGKIIKKHGFTASTDREQKFRTCLKRELLTCIYDFLTFTYFSHHCWLVLDEYNKVLILNVIFMT